MGAITPVLVRNTSGYTDPERGTFYGGVNAGGASLITNGTHFDNLNAYKAQVFFFVEVDNGDTWASAFTDIVGLFVAGDDIDTDRVAATLTDVDGSIEFGAENDPSPCWLLVIRSGGTSAG